MSSRKKQSKEEHEVPIGSQASEYDDGGLAELMSKMQAEFSKKKKKKESQQLHEVQIMVDSFAERSRKIRESAFKTMSDAYTQFLLRDAEMSDGIRKLWLGVMETHTTIQNLTERLAATRDALAECDGKQDEAMHAYQAALQVEEKLLSTMKSS